MKEPVSLRDRIIVALDVPASAEARAWVERLGDQVGFFKVGLELFLGAGFGIVDWIIGRGHRVMLDLKFFDVPQTVRRAVTQLNGRGISFATVHGNRPIVKAAVEARGELRLLAVTVLTSFGQDEVREMGSEKPVEDLVLSRASQAVELGCDGIVCSPLEAGMLRRHLGEDFWIVTPGIRPGQRGAHGADDQKRVATARQAIASGADHLVVGRPIRTAEHPERVVEGLQEEIREALEERGR